MTFRIDVQALRKQAASAANAAKLLKNPQEVSNLAGLATQALAQTASVEWTAGEISSFSRHHARLCALGFTDVQADTLASKLAERNRTADDRTVCAVDCLNYRSGRCLRSSAAGLSNPLGEIAFMLQRCPAVTLTQHAVLAAREQQQ